jgi:apolipoprotein D and lipocalin family protein
VISPIWQNIAAEPDPAEGKNLVMVQLTRKSQRFSYVRLWNLFPILAIPIVVVSACAPVSIPNEGALRNPTHPIASQVDVSLARLTGDWRIVHSSDPKWTGTVKVTSYSWTTEHMKLSLAQTGPGRFDLNGRDVWVHWMDGDNRTAAMSAIDGSLVWIMDRAGQTGDRTVAAQEILEWYGYDLTRITRRR